MQIKLDEKIYSYSISKNKLLYYNICKLIINKNETDWICLFDINQSTSYIEFFKVSSDVSF